MQKKQLIIAALACIFLFTGCKAKEKIDLSSTHTTAAQPTTIEKETMPETTVPETTKADSGDTSSSNVEAKLETYEKNQFSIQYPQVSNLNDAKAQEKVNALLKENALFVITAYEADESKDALTVEAKVVSLNRKRITVTYSGLFSAKEAAPPVNLFYSNTVDLDSGKNLGLNDFADAYTVAGYIASGDYKLSGVAKDLEKEIRDYLGGQSHTVDSYYALLSKADFSHASETIFPEVFSYEDQGAIYMSLPVNHDMGDYVLIKYVPDNK